MTIPAGDINVKVLLEYPHPQPLSRAREKGSRLMWQRVTLGMPGWRVTLWDVGRNGYNTPGRSPSLPRTGERGQGILEPLPAAAAEVAVGARHGVAGRALDKRHVRGGVDDAGPCVVGAGGQGERRL